MWKKTLCLGTSSHYKLPYPDQIRAIKKAGFDATFANYGPQLDMDEFGKAAKEENMIFQSIHAPFLRMADIWLDNEAKAKLCMDELVDCLQYCARYEVPIMVVHTIIGFQNHTPTQIGIDRLGELVKLAEKEGVKIAFENTEGIEYLRAAMDAFKGNDAVGFCWDTGHEMCYNWFEDMIAAYGDRLICTHLNDNLGIKPQSGEIAFLDDLHLLPFDGIADWDHITDRLCKANYKGILTFELNTLSKPNRHDNDKYDAMPLEQYLAEAYARACRVAQKLLIKENAYKA